MSYWNGKRAVVTGGSAGLGRALAAALVDRGARIGIVARNEPALESAANDLRSIGGKVLAVRGDVTKLEDVNRIASTIQSAWGGIDLLCNCAGRSMRGTVLATTTADFRELWETNFLSALQCTQTFAPSLVENHGHIVFIGSLASKVAAGYLGAYPASKFPLAALSQQLRIELGNERVHTLLVCPGPIARDGGGKSDSRYAKLAQDVPAAAHQPGGGAKMRAIDPRWLAEKILVACEKRRAELIVPRRARYLFAVTQVWPAFGDWLLRRMTTG
jgi:short-subunit dehydrogenase